MTGTKYPRVFPPLLPPFPCPEALPWIRGESPVSQLSIEEDNSSDGVLRCEALIEQPRATLENSFMEHPAFPAPFPAYTFVLRDCRSKSRQLPISAEFSSNHGAAAWLWDVGALVSSRLFRSCWSYPPYGRQGFPPYPSPSSCSSFSVDVPFAQPPPPPHRMSATALPSSPSDVPASKKPSSSTQEPKKSSQQ
ncbi:unnamed protein product [Cyprideis torosa]|uniref:Uncharacterized protein n=1 Tax=Cyprideis torosa TaxID=163714 RepID=A0A7R8WQS9_9CRUS|nr:unnamed protein product [Cyprideis torosa]CAG0903029.1 unnamed protein product [Cyprideis torosa]